MRTLSRDIGFALRQLRKNPGFTSISILALALGIGLSSIIFSVFYNGILYPFPYRDADRLTVISVMDSAHGSRDNRSMFRLDEIAAFRNGNHTLDDVVAYSSWEVPYTHDGISEQLHGCILTSNFNDFWGVPPLLGRSLNEHDAGPDGGPAVLLSYAFWKSHFNANKSIVGTSILLKGESRTIVGVMPKRFALYGADIYVVMPWDRPEPSFAEAVRNNEALFFFATAIRNPNVSLKAVGNDLQNIAVNLASTHRQDYPEHFYVDARPMNDVIVNDFKQTVLLLIAAVGLLLFISSSNVASLLLTHHISRAREIALRSALGASRARIISQLFVESLVLGFAGCLGGCILGLIGLRLLRLSAGLEVPGEADIGMNWPVLLFAVAVSMLTAIVCGLAPALTAVRRDLRGALQTTGVNVNSSRSGARARSALVAGQVALSMLLLVFAGLMLRSLYAMLQFDTGVRTHGVLAAMIQIPDRGYETAEGKRAFFEKLLPRVHAIPGVTHAAVTVGIPMQGGPGTRDITIPGKPHDKFWTTSFELVNEEYFGALGLQLMHGRLFTADDITSAHKFAVINMALAKAYFGGEDPIGHQIKFNELDDLPQCPHNTYFEIVGVVSDFRNFGITNPPMPQAYLPHSLFGFGPRALLVSTSVNPDSIVSDLRKAVAATDSAALLTHADPLDDFMQKTAFMKPRFRLLSFGACAGIGLGLALIGLFGVIAYSVTLQTHDFGIRIALGAPGGNILFLVLRKGLRLVGSGIFVGMVAALLSVRLIKSQLWGVSAFDLPTLLLAPLALLATGMLACYIPARRAMKVDPMVAPRHD